MPIDPTNPLYHPLVDTKRLDSLASRSNGSSSSGSSSSSSASTGKKVGLGTWATKTRAARKNFEKQKIADDAKAFADHKRKLEQDAKDHKERVETARSAIAKAGSKS